MLELMAHSFKTLQGTVVIMIAVGHIKKVKMCGNVYLYFMHIADT